MAITTASIKAHPLPFHRSEDVHEVARLDEIL